ncbi:hypothetical protein COO60DRAFT_1519832 [Scenedesmus sp. NREL 46B-D3]|nr:hypothetical protein COO60DRAFT_1519832 [Scenedesmus sp. NREL 46B-D3]
MPVARKTTSPAPFDRDTAGESTTGMPAAAIAATAPNYKQVQPCLRQGGLQLGENPTASHAISLQQTKQAAVSNAAATSNAVLYIQLAHPLNAAGGDAQMATGYSGGEPAQYSYTRTSTCCEPHKRQQTGNSEAEQTAGQATGGSRNGVGCSTAGAAKDAQQDVSPSIRLPCLSTCPGLQHTPATWYIAKLQWLDSMCDRPNVQQLPCARSAYTRPISAATGCATAVKGSKPACNEAGAATVCTDVPTTSQPAQQNTSHTRQYHTGTHNRPTPTN